MVTSQTSPALAIQGRNLSLPIYSYLSRATNRTSVYWQGGCCSITSQQLGTRASGAPREHRGPRARGPRSTEARER
ncbi:unnamed protein product, partial [Gulo gulo]